MELIIISTIIAKGKALEINSQSKGTGLDFLPSTQILLRYKEQARIFPNIDVIKKKLGHIPSISDIKNSLGKIISDINEKMPRYKHINNYEVLNLLCGTSRP